MDSQISSANAQQVYDCWNSIGVEGNGTCRELVRYIHCRNCPVYSAAGQQLLERPLPLEYRREQAADYAREKRVTQPARNSVVIFRIANEWLSLPTKAFLEVAEQRAVHSLPHRRNGFALGLVNVRGELLICASLARLLGMEETRLQKTGASHGVGHRKATAGPATHFERFLVAIWENQRVAFPVNEVHGVQRIPRTDIKEPPATLAKSALTYTSGVFSWEDRTVGLLEPELLFPALNRSLQ